MERRQDDIEEYSLTEPLRPRTSVDHAEHEINYPPSGGLHLASIVEKKRLWWRNALINALFIGSWCAAMSLLPVTCTHSRHSFIDRFLFATLLSVYNKWMFSPKYFGFPAPLFVTTMHMFVQFMFAAFLRYLWPKRFRPAHDPSPKEYG
jgi:solute carrier family 35 protein C2